MPLNSAGSLVFFSGTFSGGGSGILEGFALLKYDSPGKLSNLLPPVYLVDGGDRHIWNMPNISPMPIVAFAEHIWSDGEAHYGDHFWKISVYLYDLQSQRYSNSMEYDTPQKYSDDEPSGPLNVLEKEKPSIVGRLKMGLKSKTHEIYPGGVKTPNQDQAIISLSPPTASIPNESGFPAAESPTPVPRGSVEIKSADGSAGIDSDLGAVICPDFRTYGAWWDAAATHFHFEGSTKDADTTVGRLDYLRKRTREFFHDEILLREYGCSYLPNGTPATSAGITLGHMGSVTVEFPNVQIEGVVLPNRLRPRVR